MFPSEQLNQKLRLERKFLIDLGRYNSAVVAQFMREYGNQGVIPDMAQRDDELAGLLDAHYQDTANVFAPIIPRKLPADVKPTAEETAIVVTALAGFFSVRAVQVAREINGTTTAAMNAAVERALDLADTIEEASSLAGAQVSRDLRGRAATTAATETQAAAEKAKLTTAEVLTGRAPSIEGGSPQPTVVSKTWWSVGDNLVREAHLIADGQEVPLNEPFTVDGEQLMEPGDTSLGASPENTINCRCIAEYDTAAIAAERRG